MIRSTNSLVDFHTGQSIVGKGKKDLLGFSQMDGLRGDAGMGRYDRNYFSRKLLN